MADRLDVAVGPVQRDDVMSAVLEAGGRVTRLRSASILIWDGKADARLTAAVAAGSRLEWVHVWPAGADRVFSSGAYTPRLIWTTSRSAYGDAVAEWALTLLLAGLRDLPIFLADTFHRRQTGRTLFDRNIGIVGAGAIATKLVDLLSPFRSTVTIIRRSTHSFPGAGRTVGLAELAAIAGDLDALILACPLTNETARLVDERVLAAMKSSAWVVNVGRGGLVDHDALADALVHRRIAGACLDVTEPEPLPADHALRRAPNCVLTPHVGNTWDMSELAFATRVRENLRRFSSGEELLGLVSERDRP